MKRPSSKVIEPSPIPDIIFEYAFHSSSESLSPLRRV
nr:MAG TPA: hypothetical protein [Caudoviricetes sp.]